MIIYRNIDIYGNHKHTKKCENESDTDETKYTKINNYDVINKRLIIIIN